MTARCVHDKDDNNSYRMSVRNTGEYWIYQSYSGGAKMERRVKVARSMDIADPWGSLNTRFAR